MNKSPKNYQISVVIPAYNAEKYIQRTVDSVLSQTRRADEIIVVNDGSTDNTAAILDTYADKITVIHQENAGASIARNTGIEHASSDWIAFLDADDEWLPSLLESHIKILSNHPELVWSYSNYWMIPPTHTKSKLAFPTPPTVNDVIEDYLLVHSKYCIRTSAFMAQKHVLCESGLFVPEYKWAQDIDVFLKIAYKHPQIGYIHEPLANYSCDLPESLTARYSSLSEELCRLVEQHLILSQKHNRQKKFKASMAQKIPYWVRVALKHKNYKEAKIMLSRIGGLVPIWKRTKLYKDIYLSVLSRS